MEPRLIFSFSKLWSMGRLGNCLMQIAGTLGLAEKYNAEASFPTYPFEQYFIDPLPHGDLQHYAVKEKHFHYHDWGLTQGCDIVGYLQSEKYFPKENPFIFKPEFLEQVRNKVPQDLFSKETICIHIRRGDYNKPPYNEFYYQLPITYFIHSLITFFPIWQDCNIVILSDDIPYCKVHFGCLNNVYFEDGLSEIEALALGTLCDHFILSNSTFGWWAAWLGEKEISKIIHPGHLFAGRLKEENDSKDFWPERWIENKKDSYTIDLTDVTFTIPVFADSKDRFQNVNLCLCMLQRSFETNIIIGEQGIRFEYCKEWCHYISYSNGNFHRTKMLNDMAKVCITPYIANWDCDIIIPPMQVYLTVLALREGADMVFPYDGRFARWERIPWFKMIEKSLDIGIIAGTQPVGNRGKSIDGQTSVGGAVFFNKESFIQGGMENEHMISFGPEDCERNDRFTTLGFKIKRIKGYLHHINHFCGPNSSTKNPYFRANHVEIEKIRKMNKEQLQQYINTWPWLI